MKVCPVCRGEKHVNGSPCDVCNQLGKIPDDAKVGIIQKRSISDVLLELAKLIDKSFDSFIKSAMAQVSDLARYDMSWVVVVLLIIAAFVLATLHIVGPPTSGSEDCAKSCGVRGMDHYEKDHQGCYCNKPEAPQPALPTVPKPLSTRIACDAKTGDCTTTVLQP